LKTISAKAEEAVEMVETRLDAMLAAVRTLRPTLKGPSQLDRLSLP
jgi:hypothetical protein